MDVIYSTNDVKSDKNLSISDLKIYKEDKKTYISFKVDIKKKKIDHIDLNLKIKSKKEDDNLKITLINEEINKLSFEKKVLIKNKDVVSCEIIDVVIKNKKVTPLQILYSNILTFVFILSLLIMGLADSFSYFHSAKVLFSILIPSLFVILLVTSICNLFNSKIKGLLYFLITVFVSLVMIQNRLYYNVYTSFPASLSFDMFKEVSFLDVLKQCIIPNFSLILMPLLLLILYIIGLCTKLLKKDLFILFRGIISVSLVIIGFILGLIFNVNLSDTDCSIFKKMWNHEKVYEKSGFYFYEFAISVDSSKHKVSTSFGYAKALENFNDYFSSEEESQSNEYTDVLKGMNVIFIHMESIQNNLIDMKINDVEITPTINRLSREGMYFDNFYPQVSLGASSDSEFTLNTSLMPAESGTTFIDYYDRNYVTIPKMLSENGYYTFSSFGGPSSLWNRNNMHLRLGYQKMYFKDQFDINGEKDSRWVGLGISDYDYFLQLQSILEGIEDKHDHYMGTLIQLSNHSPYASDKTANYKLYDYFGKLDLTNTYVDSNTNKKITDKYLNDTKLGDYLVSSHYADMALGTFIEYVENSDYYENTVFVLYGDHDAKLSKSEYQYYYNYDVTTGKVYDEDDLEYIDYDDMSDALNKKTPLIIWTKNKEVLKKIKGVNHNVMGMYDVQPTIGNMMGFRNKYALGHDIYDIKDKNVVIFPNKDFVTNDFYYFDSSNEYRIFNTNYSLDNSKIDELKDKVNKILNLSNDMIVHDLINKK